MRLVQQLLFLTLVVTTARAFAVPSSFEPDVNAPATESRASQPDLDQSILSTVDIAPARAPQLITESAPEFVASYHHLLTPRVAVSLDLDESNATPGLTWGFTYLYLHSSPWHWEWAIDVNEQNEPMPSVGIKYILDPENRVRPFAKLGARTRWIGKEQLATVVNIENVQVTASVGIQDRIWKRVSAHVEFEIAMGSKYHNALIFAGAAYPF